MTDENVSGRAPVSDEELQCWAELRADDAGHLARELIGYRRAAMLPPVSLPGGWKSVASLKKGPHQVWLAHTCGYMSPAYFNPVGGGFWVHLYTNLPIDWRPTHWQELPTPPALAANSEGSEG